MRAQLRHYTSRQFAVLVPLLFVVSDLTATWEGPHMTIVELRQYTLVPGGRDTLVSLFDAHFVESQEAEGMRIVGQFRDLDRAERFVWVREFPSMAVRHEPR